MFRLKPIKKPLADVLDASEVLKAADIARDNHDWTAAVRGYRSFLSSTPDADGIWVQLGHALKEGGDFEGAEQAYQAFLKKHDTDVDIHLQLGHLFLLTRKLKTAQQWYEIAQRLAPHDTQMSRDAEDGLRHIENLEIQPQINDALMLTDKRQFAAAKSKLVLLVETQGREELVGVLGNVCKELYEFDAAAGYYERYLQFADRAVHLKEAERAELSFDVHLQTARLEKLRGNYLAAVLNYQKARSLLHVVKNAASLKVILDEDQKYCLAQITVAFRI